MIFMVLTMVDTNSLRHFQGQTRRALSEIRRRVENDLPRLDHCTMAGDYSTKPVVGHRYEFPFCGP